MTNSWLEARTRTGERQRLVSRDSDNVRAVPLAQRELREGAWTRLGDSAVLGDPATEHALSGLAQQARAAASAQGYSTGWAEGRRAADEEAEQQRRELVAEHQLNEARREAEHRAAVEALARATTGLEEALVATCAQVAAQAVELAVALTEELVGHELAVAETPGITAVRRALELVPADAVVRIRLSPGEAAAPALAELAGPVNVLADPSLQRGDAIVETADGVVDARVSDALSRVREVLAP